MDLIELFSLNLDRERPIHYIIGVSTNSRPMSEDRGKLYLKYGPIVFTNEDVQNLKLALDTHKMVISKTSLQDALKLFNVSSIVATFSAFLISCRTNMCSVHHFSSDSAFDDDYFEELVNKANKDKGIFRYLKEAEVRT